MIEISYTKEKYKTSTSTKQKSPKNTINKSKIYTVLKNPPTKTSTNISNKFSKKEEYYNNKSFDVNSYKYYKKQNENEKEKDKTKFTNNNQRGNCGYFTRVEKSKEKIKNIPYQTGIFQKTEDTNKIKKVETYTRKEKNITNKKYTTIDNTSSSTCNSNYNTNIRTKKKDNYTLNKNELNKSFTRANKFTFQVADVSGGGKNLLNTERLEKRSFKHKNKIDNQLSLSIIKLPEEEDYKIKEEQRERIRIKEKIRIQKEMPKETAEEGVGFQIFEMKICKRVSLFIEASKDLRQKIIDEEKEIEIFKKREKEINKEIDKYKKDIEIQRLKSLLDALRRAVKTTESFKKRIVQKKIEQFRNNCAVKPLILEIEPADDVIITRKRKEKKDFGSQITPPQKKEKKNFKKLDIDRITPVIYKLKKVEKPKKIIKSSILNFISNIKKREQSQQSNNWNDAIIPYIDNSLDIIHTRPKMKESGSQFTQVENTIGKRRQLEILTSKPEMVDNEVQHEYEENCIEAESLEILRIKPKYIDNAVQYERKKPKISTQKKLCIINKRIEKKIDTSEAMCNTMDIDMEDKEINTDKYEQKPKNVEIKLRTVKRSLTKMEIPLLKKLWLRKAFRTLRENCQRPPFHLILERELLRMALLKWRFVRGYGPDRYGNVYDRDGNLLYRTRGRVADFETQNNEIIEQDEQGTQYVPIQNIISNLREIEIYPAYEKEEKKETKDQKSGNNTKLVEKIVKVENMNIKMKAKKRVSKITKDDFAIIKKPKKLKNKETQISPEENSIDKMDDFNVIDTTRVQEKKNKIRLKELLRQMIYRRTITDKLNLSEALRTWLKETMILVHNEEMELDYLRRSEAQINKNESFSLIEIITKKEAGTQMLKSKNKIETASNVDLIKTITKKNAEINVAFPNQFGSDKMQPKRVISKLNVKSSKKPLVLKAHKQSNMNIYSEDYIFNEEIKRGIHHKMTEEAMERVIEILYNFISTRDPYALIRKYFTIWHRKHNYLTLLENAKIIGDFCRFQMKNVKIARKWKKISKKLVLKKKIKIVKSSVEVNSRINNLLELIQITRINTLLSKQRYLHYLIIAWLAYTRNINEKRGQVKVLYENMLTTYMNVADDVFGNNQKENPSVQDALFEAVDSTKFRTTKMQDVPLATEYYSRKRETTKITKNIVYNYKNVEKENEKEIENENQNERESKTERKFERNNERNNEMKTERKTEKEVYVPYRRKRKLYKSSRYRENQNKTNNEYDAVNHNKYKNIYNENIKTIDNNENENEEYTENYIDGERESSRNSVGNSVGSSFVIKNNRINSYRINERKEAEDRKRRIFFGGRINKEESLQ